MSYEEYKERIKADISNQINTLNAQPVLFFGSGISRRYFGAPTWDELLEDCVNACPDLTKPYAFYKQKTPNCPKLGTEFASAFGEWAWGSGKNFFDPQLFESGVPQDAYLKSYVAKVVGDITPTSLSEIPDYLKPEIDNLISISPYALITTNYDKFLELAFPDFHPIIGQSALRGMPFSVGEIFKIHGCVDDLSEMVLTDEDYLEFSKKKKFIAARLLTLFNEHPVLIAGYSVTDSNVRAILSDIDEALGLPGDLLEHIYFLEWDNDCEGKSSLPTEKMIPINDGKSIRVKLIAAKDFGWVFDAFKAPETLNPISPKILRALLARSYDLVRADIPTKSLKVDFQFLEGKLESEETFAELFGITTVDSASHASATHIYSLTELGKALGGTSWHTAHKLIKLIENETGIDLKSRDSKYHRKERLNRSEFSKYSPSALRLLQRVQKENRCLAEWLEL